MRSYPRNSPQAATRILALAMLADGHQCNTELAVLERLDAHKQLDLTGQELHAVVHNFCEDLQTCSMGMNWADVCLMDSGPLRQVLDEIDDPALQRKLMSLCISLVEADENLAENEFQVLAAAAMHWKLLHPVRLPVQLTG